MDDARIIVSNGTVECAITRKKLRVSEAFRVEMPGLPTLFLHADVVRRYRGHEDRLQMKLQDLILKLAAPEMDLERLGVE